MYELTKPRLSLLSVFTASLGYLVREPLQSDWSIFIALTLGTALAAAGAAALNQWMERSEDAQMARTSTRPLPSGLVSPQFAVVFGILLSSLGLYILWSGTNPWATILTLATLVVYLVLYTPMKKWSPYATEVGAKNLWYIHFQDLPLHYILQYIHDNSYKHLMKVSQSVLKLLQKSDNTYTRFDLLQHVFYVNNELVE